MNALFENILTASIHGSIVILAVMLLRLALRKTPRKFVCWLWLLAGLRLLMPFEIQSSLSLQPERVEFAQPVVTVQEPYRPAQEPSAAWEEPASPVIQPESLPQTVTPVQKPQNSPAQAPAPAKTPLEWKAVLPWLWGAVAAGFAVYSLASYLILKRKVREAVKIPGGWECEHIDTAFILGFLRPKIYIPMGMPGSVRRYILAHERTHLEKGDHWVKMIGFLALALHWFNPLVWAAYILLCKDIEMACDERVVQFMELEERKAYSAALLRCSTNKAHFAACPVAFGEVSVKDRILSVLHYKKPSFWISLAGIAAVAFVAVCLVTSPSEKEPDLSFLNYENAVAVVTEVEDVNAIVYGDGTISLGTVDGQALGAYLDSVSWRQRKTTPGDLSSPGSVDFTVEEDYRITIYDRNFARVRYGEEVRYYRTGWEDFERAVQLVERAPRISDYETLAWAQNLKAEDIDFIDLVIAGQLEKCLTRYTGETMEAMLELVNGANGTFLEEWYPETDSTTEITVVLKDGTARSVVKWGDSGVISIGDAFFQVVKESWLESWPTEGTEDWTEEYFEFQNGLSWLETPEAEQTRLIYMQAPEELLTEEARSQAEFGIEFLVEDDVLTPNGSRLWMLRRGPDPVNTNGEYWLEKKTDTGWEPLPTITEPVWEAKNFNLGTGMYSMDTVNWSTLYGSLPGGTYRVGKVFVKHEPYEERVAYAEFVLYENEASTQEQEAAVQRCYAAMEAMKQRPYLHYQVTTTDGMNEEIWWNNDNFAGIRWWKDLSGKGDRKAISARLDGAGFESVYAVEDDWTTEIVGMALSSVKADINGWTRYSFAESLYLSIFERGSQAIDFPPEDSILREDVVSFHLYWDDPTDYRTLTFRFDDAGDLTSMEYQADYETDQYLLRYDFYDTGEEEINAKIREYAQVTDLDSFSWEAARAEYTADKYNIKESDFVNSDMVEVRDPVAAARRAILEYPKLGDILRSMVAYDEAAKMWRVSFESYYDYQASYEYRDVYLDENGITHLMVYEGPLELEQRR